MTSTYHTFASFTGLESVSRDRLRFEMGRFVTSYNERKDQSEVSFDSVSVDDYIVFGPLDRMPTEGVSAGEKLDLTLTRRKFDNESVASAVLLGFLIVLDNTFESFVLDVKTSAKAPFLASALEFAQRHQPNLPSPPWMQERVGTASIKIPESMDFRR